MTTPNTQNRMPDVAVSLIRTWTPIAVGALITALTAAGGWNMSAEVATGVTAVVIAAYYGLARILESARGTSTPASAARTVGRFMLGGIVSKPAYLTDVEYAAMIELVKRQPRNGDHPQ